MLLPQRILTLAPGLAYAALMATQIASPQNTRAAQTIHGKSQPMQQEDIGSVLDRFHKWAGDHKEPVRELTYEEAVQRSRRRTYANEEPARPQPGPAAASPAPAPPPPIPFPFVQEPPASKPSARPAAPASAKAARADLRADRPQDAKTEPAAVKAGPATPAKKAATRKQSAAPAEPVSVRKKSAKRSTAKAAKAESSAALLKGSAPPAPGQPAQSATPAPAMAHGVGATAASAYAEAQRASRVPEPETLPEVTFAQVMAAQIQAPIAEPMQSIPSAAQQATLGPTTLALAQAHPAISAIAPLPDDAPTVHLTVRLASNEREAMRERAQDLGITPSAYVRQCALEVDALRSELEHARLAQAQAEARSARAEAALSLGTQPHERQKESEWFTRLRNFVFPRKTKAHALATRC